MANKMRLIDRNEIFPNGTFFASEENPLQSLDKLIERIWSIPTVDAKPVVHGRWAITAHEEYANFRWNVTAECSECRHNKGEIYGGFFPGVPIAIAREVILDNAKKVKLDNYCPNCGAKMDGGKNDER